MNIIKNEFVISKDKYLGMNCENEISINIYRIWKDLEIKTEYTLAESLNNTFLIELICVILQQQKIWNKKTCKFCPCIRSIYLINGKEDPIKNVKKWYLQKRISELLDYFGLTFNIIILILFILYLFW